MEFFHGVNIDWMGKAKYFVALSLMLLAIGWISILRQVAGPDLRHRFPRRHAWCMSASRDTPPIDKIRKGLARCRPAEQHHSAASAIFPIPTSKNDVVIGLEQKGQGDEALDAGKQTILDVLHKTFGDEYRGKPISIPSPPPSSARLSYAEGSALRSAPTLATATTNSRSGSSTARDKDARRHRNEFRSVEKCGWRNSGGVSVLSQVATRSAISRFATWRSSAPRSAPNCAARRFCATLYALAGMLVYIAFRFEWVYGAAAVIAVFHDVLITLGFFSLFHYEISLTVIAALLTLVGYSMNDTIVIFDRVRENLRLMRRESLPEVVNKSINQTLSRTILTSGLTFLTVLVLYLHGRRGSSCFLFCHGGRSCGRNVLQFWHRSSDCCVFGISIRVGKVPASARRIRSRKARSGNRKEVDDV